MMIIAIIKKIQHVMQLPEKYEIKYYFNISIKFCMNFRKLNNF